MHDFCFLVRELHLEFSGQLMFQKFRKLLQEKIASSETHQYSTNTVEYLPTALVQTETRHKKPISSITLKVRYSLLQFLQP